ncbi:MAG: hypothetical protein ACR2GW_12830 [Pyrinomonadaceae bacterium]
MGFSKQDYSPEIAINVTHPWHPGETFTFHFPKALPQAALDAERQFLGLPDAAREGAHRQALIGVVAEMLLRAPEGFADFPTDDVMPENLVARPLPQRVREYFDDPGKPELEAIIAGAWRAYKAAAQPSAYLKSRENHHAASVISPSPTE